MFYLQVSQYEDGTGRKLPPCAAGGPPSAAIGGASGGGGGAGGAGGSGASGHPSGHQPPLDLDVDLTAFKWNEDDDNLFSFLMDPAG